MQKILCDKCGEEIPKEQDRKYTLVIKGDPATNRDWNHPPSKHYVEKEICAGCASEIEQSFKY